MKKLLFLFMSLMAGVIFISSGKLSKEKKNSSSTEPIMTAKFDSQGQVILAEDGEMVLRYAYNMVYEDDEFAFNGLDANEYVKTENDTFMANPSIYAVARSNYIHPLYGLNGEILTRDWSKDHPHHRGIYWAWPEVDFGKTRSDLHALQKVFARPTGRIKLQNETNYTQVEAENLWIMEEEILPIAREIVLIRAYAKAGNYRVIDLVYNFEGLKDSVTIARRGTDAYGGLNIRMMTPKSQELSFHADKANDNPRRAWSDLSGVFSGNDKPSGLTVFQHNTNPEYPGDWVEYPELSWVQPTFPTSGTRYPLEPGKPLELRFRLVVHSGGKPDKETFEKLWNEYHANRLPDFELSW